jgi:DNA-binding HxlR family transcriptional regulator
VSGRHVVKDLPDEPADRTLKILGGRWKIKILFHVLETPRRFSELERLVHGITQKVLAEQLRELEAHGLITRQLHAAVPPRVEYLATDLGRGARPLMRGLCAWGAKHADSADDNVRPRSSGDGDPST